MLEQLWKNVFGSSFDYVYDEERIKFVIPRGCPLTLYDFSQKLEKIQEVAQRKIFVRADLTEEGLLYFHVMLGEPFTSEENKKDSEVIDKPKRKPRAKKEVAQEEEVPQEQE